MIEAVSTIESERKKVTAEAIAKTATILFNQQRLIEFVEKANKAVVTDLLVKEFISYFKNINTLGFTSDEKTLNLDEYNVFSEVKSLFGGEAMFASRFHPKVPDCKEIFNVFKQQGIYEIPKKSGLQSLIEKVENYDKSSKAINQKDLEQAISNAKICKIKPNPTPQNSSNNVLNRLSAVQPNSTERNRSRSNSESGDNLSFSGLNTDGKATLTQSQEVEGLGHQILKGLSHFLSTVISGFMEVMEGINFVITNTMPETAKVMPLVRAFG